MPQRDPKEILSNTVGLEKGWALRCKQEIKRFSEGKKKNPVQKFDIRERSGIK